MSKRITLLVSLAGVILLLRGIQFYDAFTKEYVHEAELGFVTDIRNGHLSVESIVEKRYTGKPTAGFLAGLKAGDEILAIYNSRGEGKELKRYFDLGEVWKTLRHGEPWSMKVLRGGNAVILQAPPVQTPVHDLRVLVRQCNACFQDAPSDFIRRLFPGFREAGR